MCPNIKHKHKTQFKTMFQSLLKQLNILKFCDEYSLANGEIQRLLFEGKDSLLSDAHQSSGAAHDKHSQTPELVVW